MRWTSEETFEIDGTKFRIDYTQGGEGRKTTDDEFIIVKFPSFIRSYLDLQYGGFRKILEVGVFQGGSFVFFDKLLKPSRISAVEVSDRPLPHLDNYVAANAGRARVHTGVSQGDADALIRIIDEDFGGEVDLVVDDASHFYELTRTTFLTTYPRLRPGGLYVIEDWGWSFHPPFQGKDAPWSGEKALVNLVFELLEEVSLNNSIAHLKITSDMVMIRKPLDPAHSALLTRHGRRDRQFPEL